MSADLASIGLGNITILYFTENLSDYKNKIASHYHKLRRRKLINSTWAHTGEVFIKEQDNGDLEEIKHLSRRVSRFPKQIFRFND